jgi:16S rRNA processing protein RimM
MEYIKIGKIVNTHGVKGELKIQSCSDFDAERYQKGNKVYVFYEGQYIPYTAASFRVHKGFSLVSFAEAQNINDVEKYKESSVYMRAEDRKPLKHGEYYRDQLVGLLAVDEEGSQIGTVAAVEETCPGQTHLRIERQDREDALVPYIPVFIKKVDMEEKKIIIHKEEGLL